MDQGSAWRFVDRLMQPLAAVERPVSKRKENVLGSDYNLPKDLSYLRMRFIIIYPNFTQKFNQNGP